MFELLTLVLLWLLVGIIIWYVLQKLIPKEYYTWLGAFVMVLFIILAFLTPTSRIVSTVWSVLSLPFKPLGLSLLLLASAAAKMDKGGLKKPGGTLVIAALLILLISSTPFVAYALAQKTEQSAIQFDQQRRELCDLQCPTTLTPPEEQTAAAIAVLGWGTTQANLPYRRQIQLTDTGDRIIYAAQLYQDQLRLGNRPLVIVSAGPRGDLQGKPEEIVEARDIETLLINMGVARDDIVVEPTGVDVRTSAVAVGRILMERRLGDRVILVTSATNTRRAALTFARAGIRVIPRPTNFYTFESGGNLRRRLRLADFVPSADTLVITTRVIEEYLLSVYYFLRGWLAPLGI
ncbi:MAG: YdcF family protein [Trichocoleus desertorum ATA4-8-CV12]|jgi:uncharacterized SAM-binding protein YcdF (DUF218 family)|nr:YdcF family protein [Trichocoleus desertorum ATA4-8-CV12]